MIPESPPDATLDQRNGWRNSCRCELRDHVLHILVRRGGNEYRSKIPTEAIDPNTMEHAWRSRKWLLAGILLAATGAVIVLAMVSDVKEGVGAGIAMGLIFALGASVSLLFWSRWHSEILVFDAVQGGIFLGLAAGEPSAETVSGFLDTILGEARVAARQREERAAHAADTVNAASEIRRFHGLLGQGVLTEEEFAAKKRSLLDAFLGR